jgi:hypothetical protein
MALLRELATPASARRVGAGTDRVVPVDPALRPLLPWPGLRRGAVVAATGTGATSLTLALAGRASRDGARIAGVGLPEFGALAAAEIGVCLDRVVLVPHPGAEVLRVLGYLTDGVELIVAGGAWTRRVTATQAQRITARLRQHGVVLLVRGTWPGADLTARTSVVQVDGLGDGHGRIRSRQLLVEATGRSLGPPRRVQLVLPAIDGGLKGIGPAPIPAPRPAQRAVAAVS